MVYVALLRGINVGGNSMVSMAHLREIFEGLGLANVATYINSGNVIFSASQASPDALTRRIEKAIEDETRLPVKVLIRSRDQMRVLGQAIPRTWVNDQRTRTDVMFLWKNVDKPSVLKELPANREIEDIKYVKGAVLWRIDRKLVRRSRMSRIIGTPLYKQITIRNANTVRKLYELMQKRA